LLGGLAQHRQVDLCAARVGALNLLQLGDVGVDLSGVVGVAQRKRVGVGESQRGDAARARRGLVAEVAGIEEVLGLVGVVVGAE
jgi:hypothetical protein